MSCPARSIRTALREPVFSSGRRRCGPACLPSCGRAPRVGAALGHHQPLASAQRHTGAVPAAAAKEATAREAAAKRAATGEKAAAGGAGATDANTTLLMGPLVRQSYRSRDLSSLAWHGPGVASFTLGKLASPPSAGDLAHHRTGLRRSTLLYPSAELVNRAPRYLWSTIPESRSVDASLQKTSLPRALGCQLFSSDPSDVAVSPAVTPLHLNTTRDTLGVSVANTSGGVRGHRHWVASPVPQG